MQVEDAIADDITVAASYNYRPARWSIPFYRQRTGFESGLDYFIARHYANNLGRFLQIDPLNPILDIDGEDEEDRRQKFDDYIGNPQNWNRYVYALNNPLVYVDEDGQAAVPIITLVVAAAAPFVFCRRT